MIIMKYYATLINQKGAYAHLNYQTFEIMENLNNGASLLMSSGAWADFREHEIIRN